MSQPIIVVDKLTKQYDKLVAVDQVSFDVPAGEIFGFLGPNGAGKTTTISMLVTRTRPTSGSAKVAGYDIIRQQKDVRRSIGLVFQEASVDDRLTATENLEFHAVLYNVPTSERKQRIAEVLEMLQLADRASERVERFSGGMKRRLEIARALVHRPRLLFLDEPTIGLDPQARRQLWEYVLMLREREGMSVFLTTHYLEEAEYAARIAVMDHGQIIALDTPHELKRRIGGDIITVVTGNPSDDATVIAQQFGVAVDLFKDELRFEVPDGASFIPQFVRQFNGSIQTISQRQPTLDDVFLKLTGRSIRDEDIDDTTVDRARLRKTMQTAQA